MIQEPKAYYLTDAQVGMIEMLIDADSRKKKYNSLTDDQRTELMEAFGIEAEDEPDTHNEHFEDLAIAQGYNPLGHYDR